MMDQDSPSRSPVALLSDFGFDSLFAGTMKAVVLSINPNAQVFDLSHGVTPQAVEEGAFLLASVIRFLPQACICVAVVDPGVGTQRAAVALQARGRIFVGPDNGILSAVLDESDRARCTSSDEAVAISVPASLGCVRLTNSRFFQSPVSQTFQGRDVFASVAGHLSLGVPLSALGDPHDSLVVFPPWRAVPDANGEMAGRILSIDHFGNLVTDVLGQDIAGKPAAVSVGGVQIESLSETYHGATGMLAYVGSAGFMEIALRDGSAAAVLGARLGDGVSVTLGES